MKSILSFLILVSFLTACNSKKSFTSRKYMSGRYVSNTPHKPKVTKHKQEKLPRVGLEDKNTAIVAAPAIHPEPLQTESVAPVVPVIAQNENEVVQSKKEAKAIKMLKNNHRFFEKKELIQAYNKSGGKDRNRALPEDEPSESGNSHLISVFISAGAIMLAIAAFVVALLTFQYYFLFVSLLALILGILGLVMGMIGMNSYRKEKMRGNKQRSRMVLGIIGTALGGAAIFLALYFAIIGAFVISE